MNLVSANLPRTFFSGSLLAAGERGALDWSGSWCRGPEGRDSRGDRRQPLAAKYDVKHRTDGAWLQNAAASAELPAQ